MTSVRELTSPGLADYLVATPGGVIVDFWSQWCKRCLRLRPQLEQLAAELQDTGWSVVAVNAETESDAAEAFEVRSLPTIIVCIDGKEQDRLSGSVLCSSIEERIARYSPQQDRAL